MRLKHIAGECSFCDARRKPEIHPTAEQLLDDCEEQICPTKQDILPSILQEAQRLVFSDRNETYGDPLQDYTRTIELFKIMVGDKNVMELTPQDGVTFMICVKLSREAWIHKTDNLVDLCGYAACLEWIHNDIAQASQDA